jgi:hypothetical protein
MSDWIPMRVKKSFRSDESDPLTDPKQQAHVLIALLGIQPAISYCSRKLLHLEKNDDTDKCCVTESSVTYYNEVKSHLENIRDNKINNS